MRQKVIALLAVLLVVSSMSRAKAQAIAVRTNVAGFAALAANVGMDFSLNESNSLSGSFYQTMGPSWMSDTRATGFQLSWKHWFSHEPLRGLYWGLSAGVGAYELQKDYDVPEGQPMLNDRKYYEGAAVPVSVDLGYSFQLSKRWSLDVCAGVGPLLRWETVKIRNDVETQTCIPRRSRIDFYPTNAGISLVYLIL
jgi:hypothetical protein